MSEQSSDAFRIVRQKCKAYPGGLYYFALGVLGRNRLRHHLHLPFCNYASLFPWTGGPPNSNRKLAWMPREHFKSTIFSVALPLWLLINDRNTTIALISAHSDNTKKWLREIKKHVQYNKFFQWAFPELIPDFRETKWDETEIILQRDRDCAKPQASITAYSINSGLASQHHEHIILDDPVNEQIAASSVEMDNAVRLYMHLEEILEGWTRSTFTVVGTPWGREDVIAKALEEERRGVRLKWGIGVYGKFDISESLRDRKELIPDVELGKPILPTECPEEKLEHIRHQSQEKFQLQFLCDPWQATANGFDIDLIRDYVLYADGTITCDCHRTHVHRLSRMTVVITSDPAYTEDRKGCESSIVVIARDQACNCRFILEEWGAHVTPSDYIEKGCEVARRWMPFLKRYGVETVNFQLALKAWFEQLKNDGRFPLIECYDLKPKKRDKDTRIAGQQTPVANGWWHKRPSMRRVEGRNTLIDQIAKWPYSRLRDRVDAWAYADDCWEGITPATHEEPGAHEDPNLAIERRDLELMSREANA